MGTEEPRVILPHPIKRQWLAIRRDKATLAPALMNSSHREKERMSVSYHATTHGSFSHKIIRTNKKRGEIRTLSMQDR